MPVEDGAQSGEWVGDPTATPIWDKLDILPILDENKDPLFPADPGGNFPSPARYVKVNTPLNDMYFDVRLEKGSPASGCGDETHKLYYAAKDLDGTAGIPASFRIKLYQGNPSAGGTLIYATDADVYPYDDGWFPNGGLWVCYETFITKEAAESITDYASLWLRIEIVNTTAGDYSTDDDRNGGICWLAFRYPGQESGEYSTASPTEDGESVGFDTIVASTDSTRADALRDNEIFDAAYTSDAASYVSDPDVDTGKRFDVKLGALTAGDALHGRINVWEALTSGSKAPTRETQLWQGNPALTDSTLIATWSKQIDFATVRIAENKLTAAQAAAITDWTDLWVRYTVTSGGAGTTSELKVYKISFRKKDPLQIGYLYPVEDGVQVGSWYGSP